MAPAALAALESGALRIEPGITQNPRFGAVPRGRRTVLMSMGNLKRRMARVFHRAATSARRADVAADVDELQNMRAATPPSMPTWGAMQAALDGARGQAPVAGDGSLRECGHAKQQPAPRLDEKPLAKPARCSTRSFKTVGGFQDMVGKFE